MDLQGKERIKRDTPTMEVGEAKTRLTEQGENFLDEFELTLEEKLEDIKTDYLSTTIPNLVQHLAPVLGWTYTQKLETKTNIQKLVKDILKKAKQKFQEVLEDIKDDLPITVDQLVEDLSELTESELEAKLRELKKVTLKKVMEEIEDVLEDLEEDLSNNIFEHLPKSDVEPELQKLGEDILIMIEKEIKNVEIIEMEEVDNVQEVEGIEIDEAKTKLLELGQYTIEEVEQKLETEFEDIKTGLSITIEQMVEDHVKNHEGPEKFVSDAVIEKFYFTRILHNFGEDILKEAGKEVKEVLEEIKDDLPTTVEQLVEGLSKLTESELEAKLRNLKEVTLKKVEEEIKDDLDDIKKDLPTTVKELVDNLTSGTMSEIEPELQKLGKDILQQIEQGMMEKLEEMKTDDKK